jgi:hypothetical protein
LEFTNPKCVLINYVEKILNTPSSLHVSKEDETECVTCIGEKRNVHRILMGKLELKRKLKNLKLYGRLRIKLNIKGIGWE